MKLLFWLISLSIFVCTGCGESGQQSGTEGSEPSGIAAINAAIEEHPDRAAPYVERARYHYDHDNYGDAIQDMASAMHRDSMNEEYHLLLADIYLDASKSRLALRTLERSALLFPQSVDAWMRLAEMQLILKQYDTASASLRKVMELDPNNIDGLYLLGVMYREQGNFEQAIKAFQTVVELDGNNAEAWTILGNLLDVQDDPMALQCFENAIASDSTYPQGWHSKAFYLQNHGQVDAALEIYRKIQGFAPGYTDAYLNAGILYLERGELTAAADEFGSLVRADSTNPFAHFYLGVIDEQNGKTAEAITHYREATDIAPGVPRFAEALARLENK